MSFYCRSQPKKGLRFKFLSRWIETVTYLSYTILSLTGKIYQPYSLLDKHIMVLILHHGNSDHGAHA